MTDDPNRESGRLDEHEDRVEAGAEPESETEAAIDFDEARLFALASRIDEGHPVDWDAAEREARSDRERAIIAEMRLLADVARVGREQADVSDALPASAAGTSGDAITDIGSDTNIALGIEDESEVESGRAAQQMAESSSATGGMQTSDSAVRLQAPEVPPPATWGSLAIQGPIGRGAFSTVYRAQDNLGRLVALKLFPLRRAHGIDWAARLLHEGRLLARIRHENVVSVYGADQGDGYVGLWMELVNGRTLEDELRTRVRFSADEAAHVGRMLCRALAAVHHEGLLHRDVKAHNVMRDETGRIVLMDFGSGRDARIEDAASGIDVAGTPLYLAPEVFRGQPASIASDIYGVGVLLFHLVSNRYPVEGTDRHEIQRAHVEHRRVWLRDVRPDLPDAFVRVVERAIADNRSQRYHSAGELEDALARISPPTSAAGAASAVTSTSGDSAGSASSSGSTSSGASTTTGSSTSGGSDSARGSSGSKATFDSTLGSTRGVGSGGSATRVILSMPMSPVGEQRLKAPPRRRWQMVAAGASLVLALVTLIVVASMVFQRASTTTGTPTQRSASVESPATSPPASASPLESASSAPTGAAGSARASYAVQATFYKQTDNGKETWLAWGDRIAPGDKLGLRLTTSKPAYVYVANQDEQGERFLLYPLRTEAGTPLSPQREHRLPVDDVGGLWQVTSPGVREHFVVFVNQTPFKDFDRLLRELPPADSGRAVTHLQIPGLNVRGVGGLVKPESAPSAELQRLFQRAKPLSEQQETVEGEWIRELTLVNPIERARPASSR